MVNEVLRVIVIFIDFILHMAVNSGRTNEKKTGDNRNGVLQDTENSMNEVSKQKGSLKEDGDKKKHLESESVKFLGHGNFLDTEISWRI